MIYDNAVEQARNSKQKDIVVFRLAKVTSLTSGGRAYVQFYGESSPSNKLYPYIDGYRPVVGDTVLLFAQGSTFIIGGKVTKDNLGPVVQYLTKAEADALYLTQTTADGLYAPVDIKNKIYSLNRYSGQTWVWAMWLDTDGCLIGLKQTSPYSHVTLGKSSNHFAAAYVDTIGSDNYDHAVVNLYVRAIKNYGDMVPSATNTRSIGSSSLLYKAGFFTALGGDADASSIQNLYVKNVKNYGDMLPSATNTRSIGSTSLKYKVGYFMSLGGESDANAIQTLNVKATNHYGETLPASTDTYSLGSSSKRFKDVYGQNLRAQYLYFNNNTNVRLEFSASASTPVIYPYLTNKINIGSSSYQFNSCYAKQYYQNGTAISTSDRRKKTNIRDIAKKYLDFFKRLKPRSFRFKDGESGRTHTGFIAQEVEEAAAESSINNKDLAFLCIDENGDYGLRYDELIAIQTQVIQNLMERVERLENIVKERA